VHLRRLLTPVLVAVAAVPLLAAPAAASKGPDSRDTGVHVPRLSCTGDTLRVTAVVRGQRDLGPATLTLQAGAGGAWSATGRSTSVPSTKPGHNTWTLDASGLRAGTTSLRVEIRAAGASVLTPAVPVTSCAPGTEVPEVPIAPLLPLTLAVTAAGVLTLRSRRTGTA
jgi:hypothetical protein